MSQTFARPRWRSTLQKGISAALVLLVLVVISQVYPDSHTRQNTHFPPQMWQTLQLIKQGGPFPYRKDGTVFQNREKRLPHKPRGYYREYTVPTPGLSHRGARRIISGGKPAVIYYYTKDHYRSFEKIPDTPRKH